MQTQWPKIVLALAQTLSLFHFHLQFDEQNEEISKEWKIFSRLEIRWITRKERKEKDENTQEICNTIRNLFLSLSLSSYLFPSICSSFDTKFKIQCINNILRATTRLFVCARAYSFVRCAYFQYNSARINGSKVCLLLCSAWYAFGLCCVWHCVSVCMSVCLCVRLKENTYTHTMREVLKINRYK